MTPKLQFLQAVQQMRPSEAFIHGVAELVPEDLLPPITGVAAFELVATLDTLCKSWRFRRPLRPKASIVVAARESAVGRGSRKCGALTRRRYKGQTGQRRRTSQTG
jgi:hypothetical protein